MCPTQIYWVVAGNFTVRNAHTMFIIEWKNKKRKEVTKKKYKKGNYSTHIHQGEVSVRVESM